MRNNIMRTPSEKEEIVKEYLSGTTGIRKLSKKYETSHSVIYKWIENYKQYGIEGLKSNTGKHKNPNAGLHLKKPKNKIEELELKLMMKEIEIARLKKGYTVKGVGAKKEFVTTFDKNIK